jgi:DNA-binding transcriptional ArsR family regulator
VGDQRGIPGRGNNASARDGHGVREVASLHHAVPSRLDDDRLHAASLRDNRSQQLLDEWSGFPVCFGAIDRYPDYELEDVLIVEEPAQLRALADDLRATLIRLLKERAASTTELAGALGLPKGTVGHHLKVLERAGLIRVVRTRKVRALTEKYYGRVARLFVLKGDESLPEELRGGTLAAMMLRQAADEVLAASADEKDTSALVHARLAPADVKRFQRRLNRLVADFHRHDATDGEMHALALALYRSASALPPRADDA